MLGFNFKSTVELLTTQIFLNCGEGIHLTNTVRG